LEGKERLTVIALGSSRVQQFRQEMFHKSFYNASGTIQSIYEYRKFLNKLPKEKLPKYLIVGLDQWMFNARYQEEYTKKKFDLAWSDFSAINKNVNQKIKSLSADLVAGKIQRLSKAHKHPFYGITAIVDSSGFRNDGSYVYQALMRKLLDESHPFYNQKFTNTLKRIEDRCCRFQAGTDVELQSVAELKEILAYCKENQIHVIAFLPPFASKVYDRMHVTGEYLYIRRIYPLISPLFEKHGFELYDFGEIEVHNEPNDDMMIDGYHGGELLYVHILCQMIERGSKLATVASLKKLRDDIDKKQNALMVYSYY
jgi:hypothetical protein